MLEHNINSMLHYLKNGFYSSNNYETTLKIYLIYVFSAIALIILLLMGTNCITKYTLLSNILFTGAGLLLFNIIYLKFTDNAIVSAYIILYFLFALMFYLIYSGGVSQTGPLWTFILPPVVLFIHGFKKGLIELLLFLLVTVGMFFIQNGNFLETSYTHEFKERVVLVLFVVIMLSSLYQYTRETSMKHMKKMQDNLKFFLQRDPLTGLYNRRGYEDNIVSIKNTSFESILMCDIDHFKKVNDNYGHDAGDFVLKEVAKVLKEILRDNDLSVRWGGEEFLIFLSEMAVSEAYLVAENLRNKIENMEIIYENKSINITFSIGISIIENDISLEEAIKNADHAMYVSKMEGRNRVSKYFQLI